MESFAMDWIVVLQGIAIGIGMMAVVGIFSMDRKLGELNGSVREVKVELMAHVKLDDERHEEMKENTIRLWNQKADKA